MPSLRTVSRTLSLASDPTRSRAESNIFPNEPSSGSLARSKGSLYIVTETQGDTPGERAYCRLVADSIRGEYYRDPTQELDQALGRGLERGNTKMLKDERLPPPEERPATAITCLAIRDDELAIAQTFPVQTYIGSKKGIALVPDPPIWEAESYDLSRANNMGFSPNVRYQIYTAKLGSGDLVAVCSSALAQSLSADRLERWLTSGETRVLTQGLRANYLHADEEPAYALVIQTQPDVRERVNVPPPGAGPARPDVTAAPLGAVLSRLRPPGASPAERSGDLGARPRPAPAGSNRRAAGARAQRAAALRPAATRRLLAWLVLALVALVIIVLAVKGLQHFQAGREHAAFLQASAQVDALLASAGQQQDPAASATILKQAQATVSEDAARLSPGDEQALLSRVQVRQDSLVKASRLGQPTVLVDLSGDQRAQLSQIAVEGDNLYMLDTGGHRVLKVTTGSSTPLAVISAGTSVGQDVVQPLVAITASSFGVLAVDSRNTLWSFDAGNNRLRRVAVPSADAWGGVRAITTYKNELYVLDTKLNRIWRYSPQADGYGTPTDYFAEVVSVATPKATPERGKPTPTPVPTATPVPAPDLRHSVDLAVDGSLYVLQSDGSIMKFTNGLPEPFPEKGLVARMPSPAHVIANPEDSSVYVVDPSGKRLVRFSKDGQFERQYLLPPEAPQTLRDLRGAAVLAGRPTVFLLGDKAVGTATLPNQ